MVNTALAALRTRAAAAMLTLLAKRMRTRIPANFSATDSAGWLPWRGVCACTPAGSPSLSALSQAYWSCSWKSEADPTIRGSHQAGVRVAVGLLADGAGAWNGGLVSIRGCVYGDSALPGHLLDIGVILLFGLVGIFALFKLSDLITPLRVTARPDLDSRK